MPSDVRTGIYAVVTGALAIYAYVKYGQGDLATAILLTTGAATSLLSAVMTWKRRGWAPPVDDVPELVDPGPDEVE